MEQDFEQLHAWALAADCRPTGSKQHDTFYQFVSSYQQSHNQDGALFLNATLANLQRRDALERGELPLDLVRCYDDFIALCKWRARVLVEQAANIG